MSETPMSEAKPSPGAAVMEGRGAYSRHAQSQAAGGVVALPLLEQAARTVQPSRHDRPLLIADYGSSQGRNSLRPIGAAIAILRERFGSERPICVSHADSVSAIPICRGMTSARCSICCTLILTVTSDSRRTSFPVRWDGPSMNRCFRRRR